MTCVPIFARKKKLFAGSSNILASDCIRAAVIAYNLNCCQLCAAALSSYDEADGVMGDEEEFEEPRAEEEEKEEEEEDDANDEGDVADD